MMSVVEVSTNTKTFNVGIGIMNPDIWELVLIHSKYGSKNILRFHRQIGFVKPTVVVDCREIVFRSAYGLSVYVLLKLLNGNMLMFYTSTSTSPIHNSQSTTTSIWMLFIVLFQFRFISWASYCLFGISDYRWFLYWVLGLLYTRIHLFGLMTTMKN